MITPSEFLKKAGACDEWLARARGKTWRQMFALIQRYHRATPRCGSSPLSWIASCLDGHEGFVCERCTPDVYACLLGMPFSAWCDAIRAYEAHGPLYVAPEPF